VLSHDGWVAALAIAPSGEWLASCGLDDTVRLWDFAAGRERFHLYGHGKTGGSRSTKVAFSPDGKRFFSFGSDMYLRVYSTENGRVLAEHAIRLGGAPRQESEDGLPRVSDDLFGDDGVGQATFAPNGNVLVLSDSRGSAVHFFDITSGKEVDVFRPDDHLQNFAIAPDGKSLATFEQPVQKNAQGNPSRNRMYTLRMRDFASKLVIREFVLPGRFANQVAFSPDSKSIGFTELENSSVRKPKQWISILDTASMRHVTQIDIIGRSTRGLAFSHDGTKLATSHEDSSVIVWELKNFRKDNVISE
jgi:WD40 repeat protein